MSPSLESAYLRHDRGHKHLAELKALHNTVCATNVKATIVDVDPKDVTIDGMKGVALMQVDTTGFIQIPDDVYILTSEVGFNFRVALDYLVARLAELDSPNPTKRRRTQFPIDDSPNQFDGRKTTDLAGIGDAHVAAIEKLQPYKGTQWTAHLRTLTNRDRHNDLVIVQHDIMMSAFVHTEPAADVQPAKVSMRVQLQPLLRILLSEGLPLIQTLENIEAQVSDTLDAFKPDFQNPRTSSIAYQ